MKRNDYFRLFFDNEWHNYRLIRMKADSNCFFRSLAFLIFKNQKLHLDIRQKIVDRMRTDYAINEISATTLKEYIENDNQLKTDFLITTELADLDNFRPSLYFDYMERQNVYGGHFEIGYFIKIWQKRVKDELLERAKEK